MIAVLVFLVFLVSSLASEHHAVNASASASGRTVYVIERFNDGLYHGLGCCSLYGQKVKGMTRDEACREHRLPCNWCHPDSAHKKGQR